VDAATPLPSAAEEDIEAATASCHSIDSLSRSDLTTGDDSGEELWDSGGSDVGAVFDLHPEARQGNLGLPKLGAEFDN
jgi:hypothetical protein